MKQTRHLFIRFLIFAIGFSVIPPAYGEGPREVLILKADRQEITESLQAILEPEWNFDPIKMIANQKGANQSTLLFKLTPLKKPHHQYSQIEVMRKKRVWPSGNWMEQFGEEDVELFRQLLSSLGVPKHHRYTLKNNKKLSRLKAERIAFRLEHDQNIYNPLGLVPVTLPGVDGPFQGKMDIHVADRLLALISAAEKRDLKVIVTNAFRPAPKQWRLFKKSKTNRYPVATPGHSLHEAGFAFDVSIQHWKKSEYQLFATIAEAFGFVSITNDPIHFQANPIDFGYPSRKSAIKKNQIDYYTRKTNSP